MSVINRYFRRYSRRIQDSMGDVTRVAKESFEAPRLIKVYNAEAHVSRQFDAVNDHNLRSNMRLILTRGLSNPIVQLVDGARGRLRAVDRDRGCHTRAHERWAICSAFLTALVSIAQPLRELVGVAGPLQQGIAAGQSLFELLDEPIEPQGGTRARRARARRGAVRPRVLFLSGRCQCGSPAGGRRP